MFVTMKQLCVAQSTTMTTMTTITKFRFARRLKLKCAVSALILHTTDWMCVVYSSKFCNVTRRRYNQKWICLLFLSGDSSNKAKEIRTNVYKFEYIVILRSMYLMDLKKLRIYNESLLVVIALVSWGICHFYRHEHCTLDKSWIEVLGWIALFVSVIKLFNCVSLFCWTTATKHHKLSNSFTKTAKKKLARSHAVIEIRSN